MKYPEATWRPCPKHGYPGDDTHLGQGIVAHSMEGSLAAAFGELDNPNRAASWWFSVAKNGDVYQHVDTDDIAWTNGSKQANKKFWGIEHEGKAGEPLTQAQTTATTKLMGWLLALKGLPAIRKQTLWEHREMVQFGASATACPSNRIPWAIIIAGLEDDVSKQDVIDAMRDAAAFPELNGKSLVEHIQAMDNYILRQIATSKRKGADAEAKVLEESG